MFQTPTRTRAQPSQAGLRWPEHLLAGVTQSCRSRKDFVIVSIISLRMMTTAIFHTVCLSPALHHDAW